MKFPLLSILATGPAHGYELKQRFESRFEPVWGSINIGQVYSTLQRMQRDGLVHSHEVEQTDRPSKQVYQVTEAGLKALHEWLLASSPGPRVRDEFFMKLVLAQLAGLADPLDLIDRQRGVFLQELRDLNALAIQHTGTNVTPLLIEGAALHAEADLKWLDLCEERLRTGGSL